MDNFVNDVQIYSCRMDKEKVADTKDYLLKRYQVMGDYIDEGNPIWKLTGKREDVKNAVNDNWLLRGLNAPEDVMSKETMDQLGFKMSEEGLIDQM